MCANHFRKNPKGGGCSPVHHRGELSPVTMSEDHINIMAPSSALLASYSAPKHIFLSLFLYFSFLLLPTF
ncbi:hypothetical protein DL89DRAFT_27362 [Linderina pennispora]|uniref:Uncharacterized protein n=1 Tax=Linderina pennispora TaxID=61395 RepID=A0A1Y1W3N1_9FUNG|nr:uncharacterized protein DL89DRAFT_27362 [Linderina pennispora]ORX68153.1 hypothetical protein DL89DRAFT_27362 [Linderina pennispora]